MTKNEFKNLCEAYIKENPNEFDFNKKGVIHQFLNTINKVYKLKLVEGTKERSMFYQFLRKEILVSYRNEHNISEVPIKQTLQKKAKIEEAVDFSVEHIMLKEDRINPDLFRPIRSGKLIDKFFSDHTEEGGLVSGIYVCIGDPGVGKTTLLADLVLSIEQENEDVNGLFINSEMSRKDFGYEALKAPILESLKMIFLSDFEEQNINPLNVLEKVVMSNKYEVIVLDSIKDTQDRILSWYVSNNQKFSSNFIEKQILRLMLKANEQFGTTFILIQQINKGGDFVGSKGLEHNTTGLLEMRHSKDGRRYIKFKKNRRNGALVNMPLFYSKDKITGRMVYDEKEYEAFINGRKFSEQSSALLDTLSSDFDSMLEKTPGIKVDLEELGKIKSEEVVDLGVV